ncbi:MAG: alpha/beta hydrolase [Deltaproteobacteria bacterium]|nr:alpha/beta hydrolase [Deltaproteobacteria bacterium]
MGGIDPRVFLAEAIDPATAQLNEAIEKIQSQLPPIHLQEPSSIRAARERGEGVWGPIVTVPEARVRRIPGPNGEISVRVIAPESPRGVYLHFHGGGWALGAAHHCDVANLRIAQQCGIAVVSVDYRLAPEDPYPAGPDDCEAAALWVVEHAAREFGSERLLIGGESAGAHLAVVTLLRLRDRHGLAAFSAANLLYGAYDLSLTPSAARWGERNVILSTPIIEWFTENFVPEPLRRHPDVSPLYADLAGLPSALLTVGTEDPLLDDSMYLYARWIAAGNVAELSVWPGGAHGFNAFPIPIAERSNAQIVSFLRGA